MDFLAIYSLKNIILLHYTITHTLIRLRHIKDGVMAIEFCSIGVHMTQIDMQNHCSGELYEKLTF